VRGRRARLHRPELAHVPPGPQAQRPCAQGRDRHHGRLCRSLHPLPGTPARGRDRPPTGRDPVPQKLYGLQCRPVRGTFRRYRTAAAIQCRPVRGTFRRYRPAAAIARRSRRSCIATGRGADPHDRRRHPHESGLRPPSRPGCSIRPRKSDLRGWPTSRKRCGGSRSAPDASPPRLAATAPDLISCGYRAAGMDSKAEAVFPMERRSITFPPCSIVDPKNPGSPNWGFSS